MRKRIALIMVTVSVLLMAGCGASNSAEGPVGVDSQMVENAGQTDIEENIDDIVSSSETQEPAKEEDWEDKVLLDEYAAYGIEKDGDFYYYQGELVYLIKNQYPDSSVYSLNTDSTGTISIKVNRNAKGEITSVSYLTEEEVAKALPGILGGMEAAEYSDTNAEELADTFGILISLPENQTWIADSEYCLVDENNLRISYHDLIADADCTLLVSKNNNLNLPLRFSYAITEPEPNDERSVQCLSSKFCYGFGDCRREWFGTH